MAKKLKKQTKKSHKKILVAQISPRLYQIISVKLRQS